MSHLPDSYVCCWVGEGSFEHVTHLEGIRVNLSDVVQHHKDGSQRVDAREQTDVTKQQEQLQVVIKCSLREGETRQTYGSIYTHKWRPDTHLSHVLNELYFSVMKLNECACTMCTYQVRAHFGFQPDLLSQRKLFVLQSSSLAHFVDHLLVASPLEPVGQEGLHELIQDLTGDQQGSQTLDTDRNQDKKRKTERQKGQDRSQGEKVEQCEEGVIKDRGTRTQLK